MRRHPHQNSSGSSRAIPTNILVTLAFLITGWTVLSWAGRPQLAPRTGDMTPFERALAEQDARMLAGRQLPQATERPPEFAPFGGPLSARILSGDFASGMLLTNLGHAAWDVDSDDLLSHVPPGLRAGKGDLTQTERGTLRPGLNYVQLDAERIEARGLQTVLREVSTHGRIVGHLPEATLILWIEPQRMNDLRRDPNIARTRAWEPYNKIALDFGVRPLINRHEAVRSDIRASVRIVPGLDGPALRNRIQNNPGVSEVVRLPFDAGYELRIDYRHLAQLARIHEVLHIAPLREYITSNAESPATVQMGSVEDGLFIRPFDDAGIDGGGIDTNDDGRRINDGSDAVPPQIVSVIDNGISLDTPNFSQTATQVTTVPDPGLCDTASGVCSFGRIGDACTADPDCNVPQAAIGPRHRKVHGIIAVRDTGTTCDAPLSGSGTHGNVVAAAIAAHPSELGVFLTKPGYASELQINELRMDGIAKGSRILLSDVAAPSRCTINTLVERGGNVDPGNLAVRLNEVIGNPQGDQIHLAVLPFGHPNNFSQEQFLLSNGTYNDSAVDIDTFLWNNQDFMIFMPVGNNGGGVGGTRLEGLVDIMPDFFNGTSLDDDGNNPQPIQIAAPATAKNLVSVGASRGDQYSFFSGADVENYMNGFSSRGPATAASLRMAPLIAAPGSDNVWPQFLLTNSVAVFRSSDNDNLVPIEAQLDEENLGTSYSSAYATGFGALIHDYFAQGFYPAGDRVEANRLPKISGALVKALLAASADFNEGSLGGNEDDNEHNLRRTRCLNLGFVAGANVGVMCNSEQGYGRAVGTHVLPLANWPNAFQLHPGTSSSEIVREYPAAGLLIYDHLATGEALIDNVTTTVAHTFIVSTPQSVDLNGAAPGGRVATEANLRLALSWPDLPSVSGSGGTLVNDLDMSLQSPGSDNMLDTADDIYYIGNHYGPGTGTVWLDQWSIGSPGAPPLGLTEYRNNTEAIHLSGDPGNDASQIQTGLLTAEEAFADSQIHTGMWRVTVKRGIGGATPGTVTYGPTSDPDGDEDDNGNGRLDAGEDDDGDGLLDLPGQPYALIVAGPVFRDPIDTSSTGLPAGSHPLSSASFEATRYSCADSAILRILDTTGNGPSVARSVTTFTVLDAMGEHVETEVGFGFSAGAAPFEVVSDSIPIRLGEVPISNGILEADTGYSILATYAPSGQAPVTARAPVNCDPELVGARFLAQGDVVGRSSSGSLGTFGPHMSNQYLISGGCDHDDYLDAGEVISYGIALRNGSATVSYNDVSASLIPIGPGAAAVRVLDSPRNIGSLPAGTATSVFFQIEIDSAAIAAIPIIDRRVSLTLELDSLSRGSRLARQSYTFTHALNSDAEEFFYSTDYPAGGREVRDINRNLAIDPPNEVDPYFGFVLPGEDVTFSSMFVSTMTAFGDQVTNTLGEDLDDSGAFSGLERDITPDGSLNRGILASAVGPGLNDLVPFDLDRNDGGWRAFRHPGSNPGGLNGVVWEYLTQGENPVCGFQTAGGGLCDTSTGVCSAPQNRLGDPCAVDVDCNNFGIWHAGDGSSTTPGPLAVACDDHGHPSDQSTPSRVEFVVDVLYSPIVAKVHQEVDERGFPYVVEFQRLGLNQNLQIVDGYAGGGLTIDNNADDDLINCLLCAHTDQYYARTGGGFFPWAFRTTSRPWTGAFTYGINPGSTRPFAVRQRTFGPFENLDGSAAFNGAESGFTGYSSSSHFTTPGACDTTIGICTAPDESTGESCTQDADCNSTRLQSATPDYLPFPAPGVPVPGVCDGGQRDGGDCQSDAGCDGGTCLLAQSTTAGPVRNFEATLVGFEGGFARSMAIDEWNRSQEGTMDYLPGAASDRWQIGISFWAVESGSGATDYGYAWDDLVFEWKESHPRDESDMGHPPACQRFGTAGTPAGGQCATLTVDRTHLFDCSESINVTLFDAKCRVAGPGATTGQVCAADGDCGSGGDCTADDPSVEIMIVTATDSIPAAIGNTTIYAPGDKRFILDAVPGTPGLFQGSVDFSTYTNDGNHVFLDPEAGGEFSVYYEDPLCDGDRDGMAGEFDFGNVDGDSVPDDTDTCPHTYDPGQADDDGDTIGDVCDNCPFNEIAALDDLPNGTCDTGLGTCQGSGAPCTTDADCPPYCDAGTCIGGALNGHFWSCTADEDCAAVGVGQFADSVQIDSDVDGVGDACDFDDADLDGSANGSDPCPDVWGTGGLPAGEICSTLTAGGFGVTCDTSVGLCSPVTGCSSNTGPCDTSTGLCAFGDETAPNYNSCNSDFDCSASCTVDTDCECDFDRDQDGVLDKDDNCVLTPNGAAQVAIGGVGNQSDLDGDGIGDACDTDCTGAVLVGKCRNAGVDVNGKPQFGPGYGAAWYYPDCDPGIDSTGNIPVVGWDLGAVVVPYTWHPQDGSSVCSSVNDDQDVDGVNDGIDTCPVVPNPPVIPGTYRQRDSDRDGLGDACDPAATLDDELDGIPDDIVAFHGAIRCKAERAKRADLDILSANYLDLDGDRDAFPDTGETGRLVVDIVNRGATLTDATFILESDDPDVACVAEPTVTIGDIPAGAIITVGSHDPAEDGFTFTASDSLDNPGPPDLATIVVGITVISNETNTTVRPLAISLLADLDPPPGATQVFTAGPDGLDGTADDGIIIERFDIDRDRNGVFNVSDTWTHGSASVAPGCPDGPDCVYRGACSTQPSVPCDPANMIDVSGTLQPGDCLGLGTCDTGAGHCTSPPSQAGAACGTDSDCDGAPICYAGAYIRGSDTGETIDTVAGISCGGFDTPLNNPACVLDPDFPMDWHFHCPVGASDCPNIDSGVCVGGCSFNTPVNGAHAISLPNSLHMGAHFNTSDATLGDTTHFRALQGYRSAPINLTLFPRPGDLELSMMHLARLVDNNAYGVAGVFTQYQCHDCADVQIRLDGNQDPEIDEWGFWDKLAPFQSTYDHKAYAWSGFDTTYYCPFTPTDTGPAPPNPRGVHETLCFPQGAWSRCGSTTGTTPNATGDCDGTGIVDVNGAGVWLETKFDLTGYLGQRVEIRWIAESWVFDGFSGSYFEVGSGWNDDPNDDGWWLDNIIVTGTVDSQISPEPDINPGPGGLCRNAALQSTIPSCDAGTGTCTGGRIGGPCQQNADCQTGACDERLGDGGTSVVLKVLDLDGNVVDGINNVAAVGQTIRISASDTTFPGGCVDGIAEYAFYKNGSLVRDFSAQPFYFDAPEVTVLASVPSAPLADHAYTVKARCSADFSCTSTIGSSINVAVYTGDGSDSFFGILTSPPEPGAGVLYNPAKGETTLNWWSPGTQACDLYRGSLSGGERGILADPFYRLDDTGAACFRADLTGTPTSTGSNGTSGPLDQIADPNPALGQITYYLVSRNTPGGATVDALGCAAPGVCHDAPGTVCRRDTDCGGGLCLTHLRCCTAATVFRLPITG